MMTNWCQINVLDYYVLFYVFFTCILLYSKKSKTPCLPIYIQRQRLFYWFLFIVQQSMEPLQTYTPIIPHSTQTVYPLKFLNTNGCLGIHSKGNLCLGSFFNNFEIKSLASSGKPCGHRISTLWILLYVALCDSVSNGGTPTRNSYNNIPNAHVSTCSSCSRPSTISGGK